MTRRNPLLDDPNSNSDPGSPRVRPLCTTADAGTPDAQAAIVAAFPDHGPDYVGRLPIGCGLVGKLVQAKFDTISGLRLAFETSTSDRELAWWLGVNEADIAPLWEALEGDTGFDPAPQADPVSPMAKTDPAAAPGGPSPFEVLVRAEVQRQVELRRACGHEEKLSLLDARSDIIKACSDLVDVTRFLWDQARKRTEDRDLDRICTVLVGVAALAQRAAEDLKLVAKAGGGEEAR